MNPPLYTALLASALFLVLRAGGFLSFAAGSVDAFQAGFFSAFAGYCADAVLAAAFFAAFFSIGKRLLRVFRLSILPNSPEGILLALALGEAAAAAALLFLGLAGFYRNALWLLVSLGSAYAVFGERAVIAAALGRAVVTFRRRLTPFQWLCAAALGAALLRAMVANSAPPTDWDSLAYHLAFPKIFLQEGSFLRLSWSTNGHYPLNSEMIYLPALALGREGACHWINFYHGLLALSAIALLSRRFFPGPRESAVGLFAAALYSVQPAFSKVMGNAATDMNVAFTALLAVTAFLNAIESEEPDSIRWGALCGVLVGITMSQKLIGTWLALTLFIVIVAEQIRKNRAGGKMLAIYCAGICCTGLFWYVKNWIWTGNPIWPYMSGLFGGSAADLDAWNRMRASVTEGVPKSAFNFILMPFLLIYKGGMFHYAAQYLMIPFFTLLTFVAFSSSSGFAGMRTKSIRWVLAMLTLYLIIWFWVFQDWRYVLPVSGLIAALTAGWALHVWNGPGPKRWRCAALVAAVGFIPIRELSVNNELFVFFNLKSKQAPGLAARDRYLLGALGPFYAVCRRAGETLPDDAKVLFYRDVRGYYLDRAYAWGDPLNPGVVSFNAMKVPEDLYRNLIGQGFTHVLYNPHIGNYKGDADYYRKADVLMDGMLKKFSERRLELDGIALYELSAG